MPVPTNSATLSATASMLPGLEAGPEGDPASISSLRQRFPIESARCATFAIDDEWVPDREDAVVPAAMAALCRRCPGRRECLLWALSGHVVGYWAGTTTADRTAMSAAGDGRVDTADELQLAARRRHTDGAQHPTGDGDYKQYRSGCRCGECRAANAAQRAAERVRARQRAA